MKTSVKVIAAFEKDVQTLKKLLEKYIPVEADADRLASSSAIQRTLNFANALMDAEITIKG